MLNKTWASPRAGPGSGAGFVVSGSRRGRRGGGAPAPLLAARRARAPAQRPRAGGRCGHFFDRAGRGNSAGTGVGNPPSRSDGLDRAPRWARAELLALCRRLPERVTWTPTPMSPAGDIDRQIQAQAADGFGIVSVGGQHSMSRRQSERLRAIAPCNHADLCNQADRGTSFKRFGEAGAHFAGVGLIDLIDAQSHNWSVRRS